MSAPKTQAAVTFAGPEHRLKSLWSPVELALDTAGAFVDAITPSSSSQTSYSGPSLMAGVKHSPTRCASLQFFGEYLHAFEDTFAHRDSKNQPISSNLGLGHLLNIHEPDKTYNGWGVEIGTVVIPPFIVPAPVHYQTREARTLQMEQEVFAKMEAFKTPGSKAVSWSQLEIILKQFNAIKQDHSTGFGDKITTLNNALKQFGITQPGGNTIDLTNPKSGAYDINQAKKNRNQFLCDKDGKQLNQADYQGSILPKGAVSCK